MQCRTEYIAVQQQSMLQFWYDLIVCGKTSTTKYYIIHCRFLLNEEKHFKSLTWGPGGPIGPGRPTPSNPRSPRSPVSPAYKLYTKVIKSTHWVESAKQRWRFLLHEFWHSRQYHIALRSEMIMSYVDDLIVGIVGSSTWNMKCLPFSPLKPLCPSIPGRPGRPISPLIPGSPGRPIRAFPGGPNNENVWGNWLQTAQ